MESVSMWIKGSLLINIITFLFKPRIFKNSLFYRYTVAVLSFFSNTIKGSFIKTLFKSSKWEKRAIEQSSFVAILFKLNKPLKLFVKFANCAIQNSYPHHIVTKFARSLILSPLSTIGYTLLPFLLVDTMLRAALESFTPAALLQRTILMLFLLILLPAKASLYFTFSSSLIIRIIEWICGKKKLYFKQHDKTAGFTLSLRDKLEFIFFGILTGAFYYFLPQTTFVKLFGLIFVSTIIFKWPQLGMALTAFMIPLAPTTYSVGVIGLTFISIILNHESFKLQIPDNIVPTVLFMAAAGIAAIFSTTRAGSLKVIPLYTAYLMIFYSASVLFRNFKNLKVAISALLISCLILSLIGIYQYFFVKIPTAQAWVDVTQFPELSTRVYATLENPNVLAEYLGLAIPLVLGLFYLSSRWRHKFVFMAILSLLVLCLVLTFSRGAWLGLAISVMFFAMLKDYRLLAVILLVAIISPLFLPSVVLNRIASIGSLQDSSNAYRITIWIASLRMFKDFWPTGVGLGLDAFSRIYKDYMIAGALAVHSHNLYLQIGIEMGILGLVSLVFAAIKGFSDSLVYIQKRDKISYLLSGIAAALIGHLFHGLFDYVWYSPRVVLAFWMYFGMLSAIIGAKSRMDSTGEEMI